MENASIGWASLGDEEAEKPRVAFSFTISDASRVQWLRLLPFSDSDPIAKLIIFRNNFLNLSISFDAPIRMRLTDSIPFLSRTRNGFPLRFTFSRRVFILIVFPSLPATARRMCVCVCACGARTSRGSQFIHCDCLFFFVLVLLYLPVSPVY